MKLRRMSRAKAWGQEDASLMQGLGGRFNGDGRDRKGGSQGRA